MSAQPTREAFKLALVGVPNCGKTALFNRLTGSRQKVANYPGVTVERKEGAFLSANRERHYQLIDLPGTYSLMPATLDEAITRDAITGKLRGEPAPDLIVCVVDATNLRLSLRLVLELRQVGRPMIVALNMSDLARQRGFRLDRARLESELGVPVVETVAVHPTAAGAWSRRSTRCAPRSMPSMRLRGVKRRRPGGRAAGRATGTGSGAGGHARDHHVRHRGHAARGAAHPARRRLRRTAAGARARASRCRRDASGGRTPPARGACCSRYSRRSSAGRERRWTGSPPP